MNKNRITNHPVLGKIDDRQVIQFQFDGNTYEGFAGDTIASALLAHGIRTLRKHEDTGSPRGIYCNIGHCFECRVTVNNTTNIRACLTPIETGMVITSGDQLPSPLHPEQDGPLPRTYEEYEQWKEEKGK